MSLTDPSAEVRAVTVFTRAETTPDALALIDDVGERSWREVAGLVARTADALGGLLPEGGRLAVVGANSAETLIVYAGAVVAGVSAILVNFHLAADEVAYLLEDGGADAVWARGDHVDMARTAAASVGIPLYTNDPDGPWSLAVEHAATTHPDLQHRSAPDLIYTSGTTGFPKGVEVPRGGSATIGDRLDQMSNHHSVGLGPHLVVGPLYHGGPHGAVGLLLTGNAVLAPERFDPRAVLAAIERYRVASSVMVPTHFVRLLSLPEADRRAADVSSLRLVSHTGSPCPAHVKRAMIDWFGPVIREAYGASESGTICTITANEWLERPGSVGRPLPPFRIRVLDDDGHEIGVGESGRLYFEDRSGRGIEYRNDPDKTRESHIAPGVFTLGDVGFVDADGYVFVTGRSVDLVISGGVNIYPAECERVLREHDEVLDAAVFGVPDAEMGERLVGLVVVADVVSADDLLTYCRNRIAHYKVPREMHVVDELPRSPMGKIDKAALSRQFGAESLVVDGGL